MSTPIIVIGGGLAGSEAAWQLAERGHFVQLFEMRPSRQTGAHVSDRLGELVCSNSLGSKLPDRATGVLQAELKRLGSLLVTIAEHTSLPAGGALAVDRELFSETITSLIASHPRIQLIRSEVTALPTEDVPVIVATGPLTSIALSADLQRLTGQEYLYFYDALSPIVTAESINMEIAFRGARYERGETEEGDYINCPLDKSQYEALVEALQQAPVIELRDFEREDPYFFEGCLPVEQLAKRGKDTLAYGTMRPVGLRNPHTGKRPYAVVQLRRDNLAGTLYNIVGFQTNIRWPQQKEILRMIPGLEQAEFVRMGQMHRNTFINSPTLLHPSMQFRTRPNLFFAGQITGIEGYMGNIATGLLAAINLSRHLQGLPAWVPPRTTILGSLAHYVTATEARYFQPMKANFGILPELPEAMSKNNRKQAYAERALADLEASVKLLDFTPAPTVPDLT
jgi:methylenetetrahydrofolate--tRNA-(uracil-5-)-methyltransferase